MFCRRCGEPQSQDANFCTKCGLSLLPPSYSKPESETKHRNKTTNTSNQVRPWVRYWARMFDIYSFGLVGGLFLGIIAPQFIQKQSEFVLGMILLFSWVFVEALLLSSFQTTPGKWLLKTKIALASGPKIKFSEALKRSLKVWCNGIGIGFPIAMMITMLIAHGKLTKNGITSWDKEEGFLITHEKIGATRVLAAATLFSILFLIIAIGNNSHN